MPISVMVCPNKPEKIGLFPEQKFFSFWLHSAGETGHMLSLFLRLALEGTLSTVDV